MSTIFTVRALTYAIAQNLEQGFPFVWVKGQISNLARPSSGHIYFSLKDEDAQLQCVWFRGNQPKIGPKGGFDPLTGEVYEDGQCPDMSQLVQNGQEILCAGRLTVYAPRGTYQMVVELVQETGLGKLHMAFEALKVKLMGLGYFAQERKRALPAKARKVAVVTAATGAAIHDFVRVGHDRGLGAELRIYPVLVQGDEAPPMIVAAMERIAEEGWADCTVLIRGGGSLEDLWAFNDERVAKAIVEHPIPVLAGIGHEVDVTIADMTADVRAATPSHAAQLLWPERRQYFQALDELEMALERAMQQHLGHSMRQLDMLERHVQLLSPLRNLDRLAENFAQLQARLERAQSLAMMSREGQLHQLLARLERTVGPESLERRAQSLSWLEGRLHHAGQRRIQEADHALERYTLRLEAHNPLAPLQRGYGLVEGKGGRYVSSVDGMQSGDMLTVHLADGRVQTLVQDVQKNQEG
ncbi:MAG: exodeoxyribonuclease VII large subunit [Pseudomonadota bacterium]